MSKKSILVVLSRIPHRAILEVVNEIGRRETIDVVVLTDVPFQPSVPYPFVKFVHISDEESIQHSFHKSSVEISGFKPAIAWDKALYYLCRIDTRHPFAWLIEDDVLIPSATAMERLDARYAGSCDLATASNAGEEIGNWHWSQATLLKRPWRCSKVCAVGISAALMKHVDESVRSLGKVVFVEVLFTTLAAHMGLRAVVAPELATVECAHALPQCDKPRNCNHIMNVADAENVRAFPNNLFHPVKTCELYEKLRLPR